MSEVQLSASRIAAAVGLDHQRSRYSLYRELWHGEMPEVSAWVQQLWEFGRDHEQYAVQYAEAVSGELFFRTGEEQETIAIDRFSGTPDGVNHRAVCEVKSRAPGYDAYELGDKHFMKYMPQVQQQMWLANVSFAVFACWCVESEKSRCWRVERSDDYITVLHQKAKAFLRLGDKGEMPKRCNKPSMPSVTIKLLDGSQRPDTYRSDVVKAIAFERVKRCHSIDEVHKLTEELHKWCGNFEAIQAGTRERFNELYRAESPEEVNEFDE